MPSLKEIKGRIGSVKSTLKITSAMKLVASSKLRRAQQAVQSMLPYERQLHTILQDLMTDYAAKLDLGKIARSEGMGGAFVSRTRGNPPGRSGCTLLQFLALRRVQR